ncbi:MAG: LysR family transcriptional regulator, partial [Anaerovorax sp.]
FSKAADATFLTQPTISAHISTLEKELGMSLLDRKTKNVTPTAQGKVFYRYATAMLNTRAKAIYSLQNMSSNLDGILEIQTSTIPGQYFLPKVLAGFRDLYPNVKFYTEQSDSSQVIENLLEQKGEVGFTGGKNQGNLVYEVVFTDEAVLITPDAGKFAEMTGNTIGLEEFLGEPFIWREQGSA